MNRFQGTISARLCSLAGRYGNPIPSRFLSPKDCLKIPAQATYAGGIYSLESIPGPLKSLKIPSQTVHILHNYWRKSPLYSNYLKWSTDSNVVNPNYFSTGFTFITKFNFNITQSKMSISWPD